RPARARPLAPPDKSGDHEPRLDVGQVTSALMHRAPTPAPWVTPQRGPGERKETRHSDSHRHREEDRPLRGPALAEPAAAAAGHPGEPRRDLLPVLAGPGPTLPRRSRHHRAHGAGPRL